MQLTDAQVTKFINVYRAKFGKEISREQALEKGLQLVNLMTLTYKPIRADEYEKVKQRQQELKNL